MEDPATGWWQELGSLKTDTLSYTKGQTYADWKTGMPQVIVHRAITERTAQLKFQLDGASVAFRALASHTTALRDSTNRTINYKHGGCTFSTKERKFIVQIQTYGGYAKWIEIPRGVLTTDGDVTPAGTEFSGETFAIESLADGTENTVLIERTSDTPVGFSIIPINYVVTV
jgi:hypothetical protein